MFRPTPGRLFYLLVGLILGVAVLAAYTSLAGTPAFLPSPRPTPAQTALGEFTGAKLNRVVAANQEATKAGVIVRVNSVEEYSDGFSLTYSILSGQPGEPAPVLQPERFGVTDDRGVSYRLSALGSTTTVGPGLSVGYLTFTPALHPEARRLTINVPHLLFVAGVSETGAPRVLDGPWQIQVPLK